MKWYGQSSFIRQSIIRNRNYHDYRSQRIKILNVSFTTRNNFNRLCMTMAIIPHYQSPLLFLLSQKNPDDRNTDWNTDLRSFLCFVKTETYLLSFPIHYSSEFFFDKSQWRLSFTTILPRRTITKVITHCNFLLYSMISFFILKLKFRGKGYYIYKNLRNTIRFRFGFSHRRYRYFSVLHIKFTTKTSILLVSVNRGELWEQGLRIFRTRPINLYTGKGIRFNRQRLNRKLGKVGSYR